MAGRRERPLDPEAGPVERFACGLRELRAAAGGPTYREMAHVAGYSASTLAAAAAGDQLPSLPVALAYTSVCGGGTEEWAALWHETAVAVERQQVVRVADDPDTTRPPYRGLVRYEPGDRDLFFGREQTLGRLVELVRAHRLVILTGASGSGKSSLLRAGLLPALRPYPENGATGRSAPIGQGHGGAAGPVRSGTAGPVPGGVVGPVPRGTVGPVRCAAVRVLTPGPRPAAAHAPAFVPPPAGSGDAFVIVDQFEQVFTLCDDPAERARFLRLLLAAREPGSRLRVVVAVRADFYGRCTEHPGLVEAVREAHLPIGPMTPAELRRAVVGPARSARLVVERDLAARIVEETAAEPGGLPLMSHALLEVWHRRRGRTLTLAAYEAVGGIHGAVADTAEHTYQRLTPEQARHARRILLRLITPGQGAPDTRRPAPRAELETADGAAAVCEHLSRARLITLDDDTADLAHDALITAWPRLRDWVDEERARLVVHCRLTADAATWAGRHQDPGALYRGTRLATAREAFPPPHEGLTAAERAFLTAAITAATTVRRDEERARDRVVRRLRRSAAARAALLALVLLALVPLAGVIAW